MGAIDEIMAKMHPASSDAKPAADAPSDDGGGALGAAADDLIAAVHSKDSAAVASALEAAFMALEAKPHEESETGE